MARGRVWWSMTLSGVPCLVLDSRSADNRYGDTDLDYVFPRNYLRYFEPLTRGVEMLAVIREPAQHGLGRNAYVGLAFLRQAPAPAERPDWFRVQYEGGLQPLSRPVPLTAEGDVPFEARLRGLPRTGRGASLRGHSVRPVAFSDLLTILSVAGDAVAAAPTSNDQDTPERERVTAQRLKRDAQFRTRVLPAYQYRCAVTQVGYRDFQRAPFGGLVEAAHFRPVGAGHQGRDDVRNGVALTPTVHRLFDGGVLAFEYVGEALLLRVSQDTGSFDLMGLRLVDGASISLPSDPDVRPDPAVVNYHRRVIWRP